MRHKWPEDKKEGSLTCAHCGMTVKAYLVKRGGLPPCSGKPQPFTQLKLEETNRCLYHELGLISRNVRCLACGNIYTEDEKRQFEPLREGIMRRLGYVDSETLKLRSINANLPQIGLDRA